MYNGILILMPLAGPDKDLIHRQSLEKRLKKSYPNAFVNSFPKSELYKKEYTAAEMQRVMLQWLCSVDMLVVTKPAKDWTVEDCELVAFSRKWSIDLFVINHE